ncbi:MAG: D-tyrosyl-tRNA(Tyr) deacylase [Saprospiraceae bacterium]|nr:D-tyrosyl-tRNA(Tyr) deacylase [Bacteroidia bacterium]MBT8230155.1 D-tyrosyl-tRNA(Tyr) deacylase [Bacteroidia bacterium]MBT8393329.1 D-tyrosyl-tRNA(Tyr) deacylase [Bacteroidia bacterium]NNF21420.1 D-tyrosyl-tRNA(Tyr) deacylase [Saprospiraceae bacterium]
MRAVIQRCTSPASVSVNAEITGRIEKGLVVYIGVEEGDTTEDIEWLARKIIALRIFNDSEGKMNLSVTDIKGGLLIISQFTLHGNVKKGNRPSFINAAKPEYANKMYLDFINHIKNSYSVPLATGIFAAHMLIDYINDGPVTIIIDTKNKNL